MDIALTICLVLIAIKSFTIGSDFNFIHWIKYGKEYVDWYFDNARTEFVPKD